jgi:prepilin-type N-terminal cleavage/methylation domain-containing protein
MKSNKGFTLIEVIFTLGILSIVIGYFMLYFVKEISLFHMNDDDIRLNQDARIAVDRIVTKIRTNNGLTFQAGPSGTGMILKNENILINTAKNDAVGEINYYFDDTKGYGQIRNSDGNVIADNIKDFRLEYEALPNSPGLVKIIVVSGNNKTSTTNQYSTTIRIYN